MMSKTIHLLFIGDVVSQLGCDCVRRHLPTLKKEYAIDAVIANGENSAVGNGILPVSARHLFDSGVDVITTGNHALKRREIYEELDSVPGLLRPANFPDACPGTGVYVMDMGSFRLGIINLIGQVYLEPNACPFQTADKILLRPELQGVKAIFVDFHAEATGEKGALGYYLDGRVSAVIGTHTHVATADERILPKGTGFLSDAGMVGAVDSILGVKPASIVRKMTTHLPTRFEMGEGVCRLNAVYLEIDAQSGQCLKIERVVRES